MREDLTIRGFPYKLRFTFGAFFYAQERYGVRVTGEMLENPSIADLGAFVLVGTQHYNEPREKIIDALDQIQEPWGRVMSRVAAAAVEALSNDAIEKDDVEIVDEDPSTGSVAPTASTPARS